MQLDLAPNLLRMRLRQLPLPELREASRTSGSGQEWRAGRPEWWDLTIPLRPRHSTPSHPDWHSLEFSPTGFGAFGFQGADTSVRSVILGTAKAMSIEPLSPEQLRRCTDPEQLSFDSTADLPDLPIFVGQERPISAIRFGVKMDRPGYNIFALGPAGVGKYTLVHRAVQERAAAEPPPADWCYVNNFDQPYRPKVLRLPTGMGREFRRDMDRLVDDMQTALSAAFESEEYQARRRAVEGEFQDLQQATLMELQEQAKQRNLALLRTPAGLAFAPLKDGNVLPPEEFEKMPEEDQKRIQADVEVMQEQLQKMLGQAPRWERELRNRLRELNREVAGMVLNDLHGEIGREISRTSPTSSPILDAVRHDVNDHLGDFLVAGEKKHEAADGDSQAAFMEPVSPLRRYQVNLLVDSAEMTGAPVIYESNPTYLNLTGRVEQMAQMGALDHRLHADQTRHVAPRQRRLSDPRCPQGAAQPLCLGRPQTGAAVRRNSHRIGPADAEPDQHRFARTGAGAAGPQGDPAGRPHALLPAVGSRPRFQRTVQGGWPTLPTRWCAAARRNGSMRN